MRTGEGWRRAAVEVWRRSCKAAEQAERLGPLQSRDLEEYDNKEGGYRELQKWWHSRCYDRGFSAITQSSCRTVCDLFRREHSRCTSLAHIQGQPLEGRSTWDLWPQQSLEQGNPFGLKEAQSQACSGINKAEVSLETSRRCSAAFAKDQDAYLCPSFVINFQRHFEDVWNATSSRKLSGPDLVLASTSPANPRVFVHKLPRKKTASHNHHSRVLPLWAEIEIVWGEGQSMHRLTFCGCGPTSQTIPMRKVCRGTLIGQS